jgi:hypothetical protein
MTHDTALVELTTIHAPILDLTHRDNTPVTADLQALLPTPHNALYSHAIHNSTAPTHDTRVFALCDVNDAGKPDWHSPLAIITATHDAPTPEQRTLIFDKVHYTKDGVDAASLPERVQPLLDAMAKTPEPHTVQQGQGINSSIQLYK